MNYDYDAMLDNNNNCEKREITRSKRALCGGGAAVVVKFLLFELGTPVSMTHSSFTAMRTGGT